jgi:hypothetical protein
VFPFSLFNFPKWQTAANKNTFYTGKTSTFKVFFSILVLQNRENSPQENQGVPLY